MKIGKIGQEQEILDPDKFQIIPIKIGKSTRAASGRKIEEITAVKNTYLLYYKALDPIDANIFIDLYSSNDNVNFIYEDSGINKSAIVSLESIPRELFIYDWRYSENIRLTLEEV